ncbi:MAG: methyltransferase domain-containing protein [Bacteroidales bacterium]|nr:methyltransferase domain-containing protein [Bacteroidales bacterium]
MTGKSDKTMISQYTTLTGVEEDQRLDVQNSVLGHFDRDVYDKVFKKKNCPAILDVGCGTGNMMQKMLEGIASYKLIGVDKVERQIHIAEKTHTSGRFLILDVEKEDFASLIRPVMEEESIGGFDVINCSMVVLHMQNPVGALSRLRTLLAPNGTLVVRDIDDGLQYAWPDPERRFEKLFKMLEKDVRTGDRHCGRKIYSYLTNAGFQNIQLNKIGLASTSLKNKMLLFDMAIPTFLHYYEQRHLDAPDNIQWKEDFEWFRDNIVAMKDSFGKEDFVFSAGFMNYTAE